MTPRPTHSPHTRSSLPDIARLLSDLAADVAEIRTWLPKLAHPAARMAIEFEVTRLENVRVRLEDERTRLVRNGLRVVGGDRG